MIRGIGLLQRGWMGVLLGLSLAGSAWAAGGVPEVVSVSATAGYYRSGQIIPITVTFDTAVQVTGSPQLALNSGGSASCAAQAVGALTMSCSYTVGATHNANPLDYANTGALTLNGGSITSGGLIAGILTLPATGGVGSLAASNVVVDTTAPTLGASGIQVNNSVQPNTLTLTFSEALATTASVTDVSKFTVTNNGATITYGIATAAKTGANTIRLTLNTPISGTATTYITNTDLSAHLKVTLIGSGFTDLAGNAVTALGPFAESGGNTSDSTAPTVNATLTYVDSTHVRLSFSEKLTKTTAETVANYTLSGTGGVSSLSGNPSVAALASNGTDVTLTVPSLAGITNGSTVTVAVGTGVTDLAGNTATAGSASLTADTAPNALSFTAVTGSTLKTAVASAPVTIAGVTVPSTLSVVTGSDASLQCSIAPAATGVFPAFGSCAPTTALTVNNGDQIKLQLTSSSTASTPVSGTISLGGVTGTFTVTTAAQTAVPSGIAYTALTSLTSAFTVPDPAMTLSANGVVTIPATVTATLYPLSSTPSGTPFLLKDGGTYTFNLAGSIMSFKPTGGSDTLVLTKSYTVDGLTSIPLLEVVSGRAVVTYTGSALPVASLQTGSTLGSTTAKQVLISAANTSPLTLDIQRTVDGLGIVGVTAGRATLRLASGVSSVVTADLPTTLYPYEVANLSALGKVTTIRVGSVDGKTASIVGDDLGSAIMPPGVTSRAKVPNLSPSLERADAAKPLMQSLFDFIGSRTTMTSTTQGGNGQIPLSLDGTNLYVMPYGDVLVDTTRPDGITLASDGHYEVSRNGVYVKLTTTVSSLSLFAQAIGSAYTGGTVALTEDASLEIRNNGKTVLAKPNITAQSTTSMNLGIGESSDGFLTFDTLGYQQVLYPKLYDLTQLATTFKSLDPNITLQDNLNGTVTATVNDSPMLLLPLYDVLSPIGGIPPQHRADPWWLSDEGIVYFKYSSGSAQGFRVQ